MNQRPSFFTKWLLCAFAAFAACFAASMAMASAKPVQPAKLDSASLPSLPFIENAGQWPAETAFQAKLFAGHLWVSASGELSYQIHGKAVLKETVIDERGQAISLKPKGNEASVSKISFLRETPIHANAFHNVAFGEIAKGVSFSLKATKNNAEKLFTVSPNGDPKTIRLKIEGSDKLSLRPNGELVADTSQGEIAFTAPIAFQETETGVRESVAVAYEIRGNTYGFQVGAYDRSRALTIDPLLASTFIGTAQSDLSLRLAIHPQTGDVYIAGGNFVSTTGAVSSGLPGATGGAQPVAFANEELFVSRFSADLSVLYQSTYYGSAGDDFLAGLAIHPNTGEVYLAGRVSNASPLAGTSLGAQTAFGGGIDGFVVRLNAALTAVQSATYFGSAGTDVVDDIAIHPHSGAVYLAGVTGSTTLPGSSGGWQPSLPAGASGFFVAALAPDLASVQRSSFYGVSPGVFMARLAIHPRSGDVYFCAPATGSALAPGSAVGASGVNRGDEDIVIARFAPSLQTLGSATFFGSTLGERCEAITIHPQSGEVIIAGDTTGSDLTATAGGAQPNNPGGLTAFVARLAPDLSAVLQASYFGGDGQDPARGLAVLPSGEIVLGGLTGSSAGFPAPTGFTSNRPPMQATNLGGNDGFLARFNATLTQVTQWSFLGSVAGDGIRQIAYHPVRGELIVAGNALGSDAPLGVPGAIVFGGNTPIGFAGAQDLTVSRVSIDLTETPNIPRLSPAGFIPQSHVPGGVLRTSNPVSVSAITGVAPWSSAYIVPLNAGGSSEWCVSYSPTCCAEYPATPPSAALCDGFITGWQAHGNPYDLLGVGDYITLRHNATPTGTTTTRLISGGKHFDFVTSSGDAVSGCALDMDGDGVFRAEKEGVVLVRALAGFTGAAVLAGTGIPGGWPHVRDQLNRFCGTNLQ